MFIAAAHCSSFSKYLQPVNFAKHSHKIYLPSLAAAPAAPPRLKTSPNFLRF